MNPLPETWSSVPAPGMRRFVLVDGAMQRELGKALALQHYDGRSLFDNESPEAMALGPWLLSAEQAPAAGVDGIARGITWLDGGLESAQAAAHLRTWMIAPLPDGVPRGYLRLGDSRVLRTMLEIWNARQRAEFLAPWQQICCVDRDGKGWMMPTALLAKARSVPRVGPRLKAAQYRRLLDSSVPDQLLHELQRHVTPHATLSSRERRHAEAVRTLDVAVQAGYSAPADWMSLVGGVLKRGAGAVEALQDHPDVKSGRTGADLWRAMMVDERWPRLKSELGEIDVREERGGSMRKIVE